MSAYYLLKLVRSNWLNNILRNNMERMQRPREQLNITTFYYFGSNQNLKLISVELETSDSDEEERDSEEEKMAADMLRGFVGTQPGDTPYGTMLDYFELSLEFERQEDEPKEENMNEIEWTIAKKRAPMFQVRKEQLPISLKADIVVNWLYKGRQSEYEAETRGLSHQQVKNIIYEFQTIKRARKKRWKSINLRRQKITKRHYKIILKFTEAHQEGGFTLTEVRYFLLNKAPDLEYVSLSTLDLILRKKLNLSFKKMGINNPSKLLPENKGNLISCIRTIIALIKERFHVVFLDEFLVNRNTMKTYEWTRKGEPGRLYKRSTDFRMSFIVAHSRFRVEGLMGTPTTFNQDKYAYFLKFLVYKLKRDSEIDNKRLVLVSDNCRFHRTKKIQKILIKKRNYLIVHSLL